MHVLKYNDRKLSVADFKNQHQSHKALRQQIRLALGLPSLPSFTELLDGCLENVSKFDLKERSFLESMILQYFDEIEPTKKQLDYLNGLFNK
jgi:hypothetical protein